MIMGSLLRRDFTGVAKAEAKYDPRMLAASLFFDPVFIDRSDPGPVARRARQARSSGSSVRHLDHDLPGGHPDADARSRAAFKKGAFHMAMQAGVPIVPVVIRNAGELMGPRALRDPARDRRRLRARADRHQRAGRVEDLDTDRPRRAPAASSTPWRSGRR